MKMFIGGFEVYGVTTRFGNSSTTFYFLGDFNVFKMKLLSMVFWEDKILKGKNVKLVKRFCI